MNHCPTPSDSLGLVQSVLGAVDCNVRSYSQSGYLALTGPHSFFPTALTILLTLYVAILGFRLLFGVGQTRLSDAPIIALKVGVILALTMNWASFQTLVFDIGNSAPLEIASVMSGPAMDSGSALAANPVLGLQITYDELGLDAASFSQKMPANPQAIQSAAVSAANGLLKAQSSLLMASIGLIAVSSIAAGVLVAIGPIFIALFLFAETRGLFVGWLRPLITVMIVPIVCWTTTTTLLVVAEPWLIDLSQSRQAGAPDIETATILTAIILIFSAAQLALTLGAIIIAGGFQIGSVPKIGSHNTPRSFYQAEVSNGRARADRLAIHLQPNRRAPMTGLRVSPDLFASQERSTPSIKRGSNVGARHDGVYRRDAHLDRFRPIDRNA